jgi:hypothetical protein
MAQNISKPCYSFVDPKIVGISGCSSKKDGKSIGFAPSQKLGFQFQPSPPLGCMAREPRPQCVQIQQVGDILIVQ